MSVASAALVGFVGRHTTIHLPERELEPTPVEKPGAKRHSGAPPLQCAVCGFSGRGVRAVERDVDLKHAAAPWIHALCSHCLIRLSKRDD